MKLPFLLLAGLLLAFVSFAQAQSSTSLWDHNGSVMRLNSDGDEREFSYEQPRQGMLQAGAKQGSVVFRGIAVNGGYQGTAYIFRAGCGQFPYQVSGPIENGYRRVVLRGQAPRVGPNCQIRGRFTDTLVFSLIDAESPPTRLSQRGGGFVFDSQSIHHAADSNLSVRLGERIAPGELRQRFSGYKVEYPTSNVEDCAACAVISGSDGQFQIDFGNDGRTVIGISSADKRSRDAEGNAMGDGLLNVVGAAAAHCSVGSYNSAICLSRKLTDLWYYTDNEEGRCEIEVKDDKPTEVPTCARISAFEVRHYQ